MKEISEFAYNEFRFIGKTILYSIWHVLGLKLGKYLPLYRNIDNEVLNEK